MEIGFFLLGLIMGCAVGYLLRGAREERAEEAPESKPTEPAE